MNAKRVVVWLKTNEELSVATCREVGDLAPLGMLPVVSLKRRNIVYTEVLLLVGMPRSNAWESITYNTTLVPFH